MIWTGRTDGQSDHYKVSATKWRGPNEYHLFKTEITIEDWRENMMLTYHCPSNLPQYHIEALQQKHKNIRFFT